MTKLYSVQAGETIKHLFKRWDVGLTAFIVDTLSAKTAFPKVAWTMNRPEPDPTAYEEDLSIVPAEPWGEKEDTRQILTFLR